ncbi:MAG: hypothetical protein ICV78_26305 [Tolypothrix sp. Co-bin9]|nr:hypothetical protein [Tolypothrix sp. Co-bin9]
MPRGGFREGAGGKHKWIHGETKVVRVPTVLADRILEIATMLDQGLPLDAVTGSKMVDFSGISIHQTRQGPAVYLKDLLKAGYKIRPLALVDKLRKDMDKEN